MSSLCASAWWATENGRPEYGRPKKNTGWKMADVKKTDQEIETEKVRYENGRPELSSTKSRHFKTRKPS